MTSLWIGSGVVWTCLACSFSYCRYSTAFLATGLPIWRKIVISWTPVVKTVGHCANGRSSGVDQPATINPSLPSLIEFYGNIYQYILIYNVNNVLNMLIVRKCVQYMRGSVVTSVATRNLCRSRSMVSFPSKLCFMGYLSINCH